MILNPVINVMAPLPFTEKILTTSRWIGSHLSSWAVESFLFFWGSRHNKDSQHEHSRKSYRMLFNSGQQGPIKRESDKWKWKKLFCCAANISDPLCCWDRLRFQFSFFTSAQITQSLLQQKVIGEVAISQVEQWCSICNSHNNVFQLTATSSSSSHPHCERQNIDVNAVQWPRARVVMMRVLQHMLQMFLNGF